MAASYSWEGSMVRNIAARVLFAREFRFPFILCHPAFSDGARLIVIWLDCIFAAPWRDGRRAVVGIGFFSTRSCGCCLGGSRRSYRFPMDI